MLHKDVSTFFLKIGLALSFALLVLLPVTSHSAPARAASAPYMVKDINPNGDSNIHDLTVWHNHLYFEISGTPHNSGIWITDGTAEGTTRIKRIPRPLGFSQTEKYMYFEIVNKTGWFDPWVTDGTRSGTHPIKTLASPNASGNIQLIGSANNLGYFLQDDAADDYFLWRTNGKERGTRTIAEQLIAEGGVALGNTLYFAGFPRAYLQHNLWKSDGTTQGTVLVKQLTTPNTGTAEMSGLQEHGGRLWFFYYHNGMLEFWQSDGTTDGTTVVKTIGTNVYAWRTEWVGDRFFFVIDNLELDRYELWVTDGTENGTQMIYDMGLGQEPKFGPHIKGAGDYLYFAFEFGALYKSDGTPQGTTKVSDTAVLYDMANVGPLLFFANTNLTTGAVYLYQTDGTAQGTVEVAKMRPQQLIGFKNRLYFTATDGIHGQELWAYKP